MGSRNQWEATRRELILDYLLEHKGFLLASEAVREGLDAKVLQRMARDGDLERVAHGFYADSSFQWDPLLLAQHRCPKGIFSMDTALFLHRLIKRRPARWALTIPSGSSCSLMADPAYRFFYLKSTSWKLGQVSVLSPYGHPVLAYDPERTLCDCLRRPDDVDRDEFMHALRNYLDSPIRNKKLLLEYADALHVRGVMEPYLEVLR